MIDTRTAAVKFTHHAYNSLIRYGDDRITRRLKIDKFIRQNGGNDLTVFEIDGQTLFPVTDRNGAPQASVRTYYFRDESDVPFDGGALDPAFVQYTVKLVDGELTLRKVDVLVS